jgi:serine/threonine-protein kinase HipA
MAPKKTDIIVFAHWRGMPDPIKMGVLTAQEARGHLAWSFAYNKEWLDTQSQLHLDPDLDWFTGPQYSKDDKPNFGMFLDSMPDTWGRTLMQKREALLKPKGEQRHRLTDIDFLLGVFDPARMGGLRFKLDEEGLFLDNDEEKSIPPITDIRELQVGADIVESDEDSEAVRKWLRILLAPGSSLGGARPKSSVIDEDGELWIAKFPSRQDTIDKGAWEYVAWELAKSAGISVPKARVEQVTGKYHTFFSNRFDRHGDERIHFASAMTMTGHFETEIRDQTPSYLELAEFIQFNGASPDEDLQELWRRIVFNIAISNTDDHLRNHGFLIKDDGWRLSPAYDMNPSIDKGGLALNIDLEFNALDYNIARSVGEYFNLNNKEMNTIIEEVQEAVSNWEEMATNIGIPSAQLRLMEAAFNLK